jgi:hypothetical protein
MGGCRAEIFWEAGGVVGRFWMEGSCLIGLIGLGLSYFVFINIIIIL